MGRVWRFADAHFSVFVSRAMLKQNPFCSIQVDIRNLNDNNRANLISSSNSGMSSSNLCAGRTLKFEDKKNCQRAAFLKNFDSFLLRSPFISKPYLNLSVFSYFTVR